MFLYCDIGHRADADSTYHYVVLPAGSFVALLTQCRASCVIVCLHDAAAPNSSGWMSHMYSTGWHICRHAAARIVGAMQVCSCGIDSWPLRALKHANSASQSPSVNSLFIPATLASFEFALTPKLCSICLGVLPLQVQWAPLLQVSPWQGQGFSQQQGPLQLQGWMQTKQSSNPGQPWLSLPHKL